MGELVLPKNSRITGGKTWPKPAGATETREFKVYRWNPDDGKNPGIDTSFVDTQDCGPMVLDGLIWIKNHIDPTLTFPPPSPQSARASSPITITAPHTLPSTNSLHNAK